MKRAVSISIGHSKRNKAVEIRLLGEMVQIERIGTDGDMEKAAQLYRELDGNVGAFGVGGTDLGLKVDTKWYPLYSIQSMVRYVEKTPLVDGTGLKTTLESQAAKKLLEELGETIGVRRALVMTAVDRWGLAHGFVEAGFDTVFGDMQFSLGIPVALRSEGQIKLMAKLLMPVAGRIPFHWLYPTGEKQEERKPKWGEYFDWATVIAGDCHYIKRYMPERMIGKIIVTNTTTPEDVETFRRAGVKYLLTTTPVLEGRSFGTNMMEAAILAAAGWTKRVDYAHPGNYFDELNGLVSQLGLKPQLQEL